jgi:carboxyl-terminal processing protease
MSSRSRWLVFLVSTPLVLFLSIGGILGASATPVRQDAFAHLRVMSDVMSLIMTSYVERADIDRVMDGAMRGLADGLDPSSAYLSAEDAKAVSSGGAGGPADVGLVVTRQFYVRVVGVRDGSPAARAGLRTGDYLRMIDGKATRDLSAIEGTRLLRGQPGTKVSLLVLRGNAAEPHVVELTRELPAAERVTRKQLPSGEGYVRVVSFREGAAADIRQHLDALRSEGVTRAVIDVRGTADGAIDEGIAAARHFIPGGGIIASRAGRDAAQKTTVTASSRDGGVTMPIVLLVSHGTAGAAEVFAAALQGNKRAELVGEPTAGIAGVQRLIPLPEGRALWMTVERYLSADGKPIHGPGLQPDTRYDEPLVPFGESPAPEDRLLITGVDRLRMLLIKK